MNQALQKEIAVREKALLQQAFAKASERGLVAAKRVVDAQRAHAFRRGQPDSRFLQMFAAVLDEAITVRKTQNSGVFKTLKAREDHLRGSK